MTRHLLVLRHAKSSWRDSSLADHDRPLSPRGIRAAAAMRSYFLERRLAPDLALCSTAVRAHETLVALELESATSVEADLYHASQDELIERLRDLEDAHRRVLLVGHNTGLELLVRMLAFEAEETAARRLAKGLKTATLAELALPIARWSELRPGTGRLVRLTRPKDLRKER